MFFFGRSIGFDSGCPEKFPTREFAGREVREFHVDGREEGEVDRLWHRSLAAERRCGGDAFWERTTDKNRSYASSMGDYI